MNHSHALFVALMDLYWAHINWNPAKELRHKTARDKFRWGFEVGIIKQYELDLLNAYWTKYEEDKKRDLEFGITAYIK